MNQLFSSCEGSSMTCDAAGRFGIRFLSFGCAFAQRQVLNDSCIRHVCIGIESCEDEYLYIAVLLVGPRLSHNPFDG